MSERHAKSSAEKLRRLVEIEWTDRVPPKPARRAQVLEKSGEYRFVASLQQTLRKFLRGGVIVALSHLLRLPGSYSGGCLELIAARACRHLGHSSRTGNRFAALSRGLPGHLP
jgi:hypothetical protein